MGPQLYFSEDAPYYRRGLYSCLGFFCLVTLLSLYVTSSPGEDSCLRAFCLSPLTRLIPLYLRYLNRKHAATRARLGKQANVVDLSMIGKLKVQETLREQDLNVTVMEDKGLADVTDLKNEDFIYVY